MIATLFFARALSAAELLGVRSPFPPPSRSPSIFAAWGHFVPLGAAERVVGCSAEAAASAHNALRMGSAAVAFLPGAAHPLTRGFLGGLSWAWSLLSPRQCGRRRRLRGRLACFS